jgi:Fe-S-cluster containining protein
MGYPAGDAELVHIMDAALADAAKRAGAWLACRPGCTQCCYGAFPINALDAERLRAGMAALRTTDPEVAETIETRARAWIAEFGTEFPGNSATGILGESERELEQFEDFANDAACPALNPETGLCDVYAWRPMTCRVFGPPVRMRPSDGGLSTETPGGSEALGCCELCFVGAGEAEIAACELSLPHELEARLVEKTGGTGETVVAFALLEQVLRSRAPTPS